MLPKRSADSPTPSARPSKRRRQIFLPPSSPVTPAKTPRSAYQFPSSSSSSPFPFYPTDSPSNPFGRTRTLSASLPSKTAFGYHLPLRFQFFRRGTNGDKDGVYRVVQVPLSYTFKHLRGLVAFLFGGQYSEAADDEDERTGHLFEVRKNVTMFSKSYKPGSIRKSETVVRLSSAKDPYRYKREWDVSEDWREDEDDEDLEYDEEQGERDGHENEEQILWEAEEDYTLEHVWKPALKGQFPDDKTAIVYFHSSSSDSKHPVQIQITLYKEDIPKRVGRGNSPYVLDARGHVYLAPLEAYQVDDTNEYAEEDLKMDIDPDTWNEPGNAFARFLIDCVNIPAPNFGESQESDTISTPSLVYDSSSSPSRLTETFPSTPYLSSSPVRVSIAGISPLAFSNSFPKFTPAPPPAQRKRVAYLQKRIERSKLKKAPVLEDDEPKPESKPKPQPMAGKAGNLVKARKPLFKDVVPLKGMTREQAMALIAAEAATPEV